VNPVPDVGVVVRTDKLVSADRVRQDRRSVHRSPADAGVGGAVGKLEEVLHAPVVAGQDALRRDERS
jgi:hypothetical protein